MNDHTKRRLRQRYERWYAETWPKLGPAVMLFCIIVSTCAAVGVLWLTKVQGDEQDRRANAIRSILSCFDDYAEAQSSTSKEVRLASAAVSRAQAEEARRSEEWTGLLERAFLTGDQSPAAVKEFGEATTALRRSQVDVIATQEHLAEVRRDNPVADPPSRFCEVEA